MKGCTSIRRLTGQTTATTNPSNGPTSGYIFDKDYITEYNQPRSSQYVTTPVVLLFGNDHQTCAVPYAVPNYLVHCEPELASRSETLSGNVQCIRLEEIYADIGHTLVHYLHTRGYQTIWDPFKGGRQKEYERSVIVYVAARQLKLPSLEALAKTYIGRFEDGVDIFQIIGIAQKVWHIISKNQDCDYLGYFTQKIGSAFEKDRDLSKNDEFMESSCQPTDFGRFLVRALGPLYSRKISKCSSASKEEEDVGLGIRSTKRRR